MTKPGRRQFLQTIAGLSALTVTPWAIAQSRQKLVKRIPGTNEDIPVVGMGSWGTFDVGSNARLREQRVAILQNFFKQGGGLIDSSPMYGSSEANIGYCLEETGSDTMFSATKVWVLGQERGIDQMNESASLWGVKRFDLMQIHNFLDWKTHLRTLRRWKEEGRVRYIGITTSHGRRTHDMAQVIANEPDLDFVQFTYNIADRDAERRLLPLAAEHGKAVIINRPFRRKQLINAVARSPLPDWAADIECDSWPQFLLKFIVSHPAITCAIPATSRVDHMIENMSACHGSLPDAAMRQEMIRYFETV
ncbi:MAG: aldo/keto reductase [Gammaproteobacteria bacterium]|nr:aldo/keto reductase [Gammaproteobacteria bacterium]MDH3768417.1 aldo/keto reductase [Gammaproteobacteria bacterium]